MTQEEIQSPPTSFPSFLDWEPAQRECWPISIIRISAAELRAFYTSWYAGTNGPLADSSRNARANAIGIPNAWSAARTRRPSSGYPRCLDREEGNHHSYRTLPEFPPPNSNITCDVRPTELTIPDFGWNHRAVAAFLTGKEAFVTALAIRRTADPHALPDLVHWSTKHNLRLCQHDRPSVTALLALPFRCQTASDAEAFPASMNGFTISATPSRSRSLTLRSPGGN